MKKHSPPLSDDLPAEVRAYLETIPPTTLEQTARVAKAVREAQADPEFEADVAKMVFVNEMMLALDERGETKATLAQRLGKSRQYIQKLFNEDKRVNFTIDTLFAIAHALGRRLRLTVCKETEETIVITRPQKPVAIQPIAWEALAPRPAPSTATLNEFVIHATALKPLSKEEELHEHPLAA